jgi:glutathione S-transferase
MKLYGTTTSPFARRVRIVAAEIGEPVERVDTATEAGQAALREVSPIRKVPVAIVDGRADPLFDSRSIIDWIVERRGAGELAIARRDRYRELDLVNAIDTALDSTIQLFYLRRDGIAIDGTPFAQRQLDRAAAIFAWLDARAPFGDGLALSEISLVCALDWMQFRSAFPVEQVGARVLAVRDAWRDRPSFATTRPVA